ncbi:Target SNARE coiled-coil homology domain [Dillenia turbinata]|uniref:Target SNARE coiled-coil homology domain n=1 Tax=Dillenia turbinata TaxID=194707 RepID=A0AAN8UYM7_9MAGN
MTVIDLITRVDAICKKYEKYDVDKQKELNVIGDDAFARLFAGFESETDALLQKSEAASMEKNRATVVAIMAEIRRTKARLLEEIPKLQRLAMKKVKGLSKEELEARSDLVSALKEKIESIPDGSATGPAQATGWAASASRTGIKIDTNSDGRFSSEYFQRTEESDKFRQEYEMRKLKQASFLLFNLYLYVIFVQDEGLDVIAEGLDTLKSMAHDLNEELDRQVPLMDEIDEKVDKASSDLKSTNVRLKETVNKLRSSRNFCIDIILLCIILGIAAYLYK